MCTFSFYIKKLIRLFFNKYAEFSHFQPTIKYSVDKLEKKNGNIHLLLSGNVGLSLTDDRVNISIDFCLLGRIEHKK